MGEMKAQCLLYSQGYRALLAGRKALIGWISSSFALIGQHILSSDWSTYTLLWLVESRAPCTRWPHQIHCSHYMENSMSYLACLPVGGASGWRHCCVGLLWREWIFMGFEGFYGFVFECFPIRSFCFKSLNLSSVTGRKPFPKRHSGWIRVLWRMCRGWLHGRFSLSQGVALYKQMRILRIM